MSKMISGLLGISKNVNKRFALRIAVGISAFLLVMAGEAGAVTPINDCTTISSPGTYALTRNIGNSANTVFCIAITSSDVVFDGSGFTIDGIDAASTYGVYVNNPSTVLTNVTLKNLIVKNWKTGINYSDTQNGIIDSNDISRSSDYGIYLSSSSNNLLSNNIVYSNGNSGIELLSSNNNILNNNDAHSNGCIGFGYCGGSGIQLRSSNNNTLNNNIAYKNSWINGIALDSSNHNILNNNIANDSNQGGIVLTTSSNNKLTGNNISHQISTSIALFSSSNDNILSFNKIVGCCGTSGVIIPYGIGLISSSNNVLFGNIISDCNFGITLQSLSMNNTVNENNISNNGVGISLSQASNNNIYNNYFNNSNNFNDYPSSNNTWNIAKTPGTNIVGGPYLGGNVWAYPSGTGYSQTCNDVDSDGICDSSRTLDANDIDFLPLVYSPIPTPAATSTITTVKITATTTAAKKTAVTPTITTGKITPTTTVTVSPNVPGFEIVSMILGVGITIFLIRRKK